MVYGKDFSAQVAELVFSSHATLEKAQAFYRDLKGRLPKYGRTPDDLQSSWAADFQRVVGDTQSIGQGHWDPAGLRRWAGERILATWLWVGLVSYRMQVLMGWLFFRPTSSAPQTKPSEPLLPPNLDDRPPPRIPGT